MNYGVGDDKQFVGVGNVDRLTKNIPTIKTNTTIALAARFRNSVTKLSNSSSKIDMPLME